MESKVSLKDRIRRTRSLIFSFGSQKPTPTENQPRHPYFRGPPGRQNQLLVLRVDRQYLPCEVERELKYACYRLARNVERGIPSVDLNHRPEAKPEPESGSGPGARSDGLDLPASKGGNNNSNKSNENKPRPQSSSLPCTLRSAKGRYASGTTTQSYGQHKFDPAPWQRWSALMMPSELDTEADTEICSDSSRIPSSSTKSEGRDVVVSAAQGQGQVQAQAQTQVQDMLFSSGETLVANDPNSHAGNGGTGTSSAGGQDKWPNVRVPADIKDDPQTENLCENNDPAPVPTSMSTIPDTTAPPVAPSLSRPDEESTPSPSSSSSLPRLVRKRAVENLHDESVREGHNPNPNTNPSPGPGLGLGYRKSTGGTTTTTIPPKSQNHAPSAPRARYSWLPKTKTGLRPASTIELGAACRRQSAAAAGGGEPAAAQEASVIIDSNGVRHTISAAEEAARDEDLRDAVREKMATGRIRAKPQPQPQPQPRTGTGTGTGTGVRAKPRPVSMSTSGTAFGTVAGNNGKTGRRAASSPFTCLDGSHGKSCAAASASVVAGSAPGLGVGLGTGNGNANANANANGNGPKAKDTTSGRSPFQPTKRRSILHKLSFLGFGRQKGKDVVGFGRMVEAA